MGRWTIWLLLAALVVGCGDGGAAVAKRRNNLMTLGLAYHQFNAVQQRPPASISELADYMRSGSDPDVEDAVTALEDGDIVMNWNGDLGTGEDAEENGLYVLGFEARAPASGGYVVMADGFVQLMTGKDFSEATMVAEVEEVEEAAEAAEAAEAEDEPDQAGALSQ